MATFVELMDKYIERARQIIGEAKTLPVLPASAQSIIQSATDEFVSLKTLSGYIEQDPAISARIVGLSNSAFYALATEVVSVEDAIVRALGLDLTRGIAVGMACSNTLNAKHVPGFDLNRFMQSSLESSSVMSFIAANSDKLADQTPICSLAGLLSNIGLLAAVALMPTQMQALMTNRTESMKSCMVFALGCDYRHLGAALSEKWTLPQELQKAFISHCSTDFRMASCMPLHACLHLANVIKQYDLSMALQLPEIMPLRNILGLTIDLNIIYSKRDKIRSNTVELASTLAAA